MATMLFALALLLMMAMSGVIAKRAPRTLVQTADEERADHGHRLIGTGSRIS